MTRSTVPRRRYPITTLSSPFSQRPADTAKFGSQPSLPETSTVVRCQRSTDSTASRGSTSPALWMKRALPAQPTGVGFELARRPGLEVCPKPAVANVSHPDSVGQPHRSIFLTAVDAGGRRHDGAWSGYAAVHRQRHRRRQPIGPASSALFRALPRLVRWARTRRSGYPGRRATFRHHARSGRDRPARHAPSNVQQFDTAPSYPP